MSEKRIDWIDSLKGFGIFLVTFAHLNPWYTLETHIYSFHMCLFFFISGFLFKQKESLKDFVIKKTKSILFPFIIWDLLASIVAIVLGESVRDTIYRFFVINGELCWDAPIWFLLILFFAEVIYACIMRVNNTKKTKIIVLLVCVALWILFGSYSVTFKLNLIPLALFFYGLGDIIHQEFDNKALSKHTIFLSIIIFGMLSIVFGAILNIRISYTGGTFGNILFCIIASVSGTLLYYLTFKHWIGTNKLLSFLGKNSLIIMAAQYWFFKLFDFISQRLWGLSVWYGRSTIKALIVAGVTIALILIGVSLFKYIFRKNEKVLNSAKYLGIR